MCKCMCLGRWGGGGTYLGQGPLNSHGGSVMSTHKCSRGKERERGKEGEREREERENK